MRVFVTVELNVGQDAATESGLSKDPQALGAVLERELLRALPQVGDALDFTPGQHDTTRVLSRRIVGVVPLSEDPTQCFVQLLQGVGAGAALDAMPALAGLAIMPISREDSARAAVPMVIVGANNSDQLTLQLRAADALAHGATKQIGAIHRLVAQLHQTLVAQAAQVVQAAQPEATAGDYAESVEDCE